MTSRRQEVMSSTKAFYVFANADEIFKHSVPIRHLTAHTIAQQFDASKNNTDEREIFSEL